MLISLLAHSVTHALGSQINFHFYWHKYNNFMCYCFIMNHNVIVNEKKILKF